jgi:hypothetical protein
MPTLDADPESKIPETELDLPNAFLARITRDEWVQGNFEALPRSIKGELADLWQQFDGAKSQEKLPLIVQLPSLLIEYFEGAGSFLQALTDMSDTEVRRHMPERSDDDGGTLSPAEESLCRELPDRIAAETDPNVHLAMQIAHIRLLNKLGVNTFSMKRQYGLTNGWTDTRKRFLGYTTAQLASGKLDSHLQEPPETATTRPTEIQDETAGGVEDVLAGDDQGDDLGGLAEDDEDLAAADADTGKQQGDQENAATTSEARGEEGEGEDEEGDPLPPSVRARYEQLVREFEALPKSTTNHFTAPQRAKAVEILALLREYQQLTPEITQVTGRLRQQVIKYAAGFGISPLSADEQEAINLLRSMIVITGDRGRIMPPDQKRVLVALIRLLRKGNRDTEIETLFKELKITAVWRHAAEKKFREVLTKDLVPEAFAKAEEKREAAAMPLSEVGQTSLPEEETRPHADGGAEAASDTQRVGAEAPFAAISHCDVRHPGSEHVSAVTLPSSADVPADARRFVLLQEALQERRELVTFLKSLPAGDSRVAVMGIALQSNATVLSLLGLDGVATEAVPTPVELVPSRRNDVVAPQGPIEGPVAQYRTSSGAVLTLSGKVRGLVAIFDGTEGEQQPS